jgi:3-hydroxymyristoyl/3-hydroxydecanoyl-(acyl carrier protein) dehydratase
MNSSPAAIGATFLISRDHPALPGHFPGNPVVPGVVVLDHVIWTLAAAGVPLSRLRNLRQAKFIEPLLPDEEATVTAEIGDATLSFIVTRGSRTIAKGAFDVGNESAR